MVSIYTDNFYHIQMLHWKLDAHRDSDFNHFKTRTFDGEYLEIPRYSDDVWWRYYTSLHMTGTATRLTREEHILNLDRIESMQYYSKETMNAMESRYMARIAVLKEEVSALDDQTYEEAAKIVVHRAKKRRQHFMSTQPKINNRTGRRIYEV